MIFKKDMIYAAFLSRYFTTTSTIFALKFWIAILKIYIIKFSSSSSYQYCSMLCAGLPNPFYNTMQSMASQICDDQCTDVEGAKVSTVGMYPQPSKKASTGMISLISCSLVKSGDLVSIQKL
jgi:hypothetical protein